MSNKVRNIDPGMGQAVAERTILRKRPNGTYETWGDVAKRVSVGNSLLCKTASEQQAEQRKLEDHISRATILMSGRHLQHGDENQPNKPQDLFSNCSVTATSFCSFLMLLQGSGVGRCYDDDMMLVDWDNAPNLRCVLDESHPDFDFSAHESARDARHKYGTGKDILWFTVPDTREGWAKALEIWENAAFEKIHRDKLLILDFSDVRPKGSPIAGMQDRPASGPVPLMNAFAKAATLKGAGMPRWKQAMVVDHYFASCVLVGGVRRASRMSTKFWKDPTVFDFIQIKRPIEYAGKTVDQVVAFREEGNIPFAFLWSSNNSVTVDDEFWQLVNTKRNDPKYKTDLCRHARRVFNMICACSYGDGTGEPGIINVHKLVQNNEGLETFVDGTYIGSKNYQINEDTQIYLSKLAKKAIKKKYPYLTNPCVTGDTLVLTKQGEKPIVGLVGKSVEVWNGIEWSSVVPYSTGVRDICRVRFSNDKEIRCTLNHRFVLRGPNKTELFREAKDLKAGDYLFHYRHPEGRGIQPNVQVVSVEVLPNKEETYCFTEPKNGTGTFNGIVTGQCGEIVLHALSGLCVIADVVPYHADSIEDAEDAFRVATRALIRVNTMDSVFNKEVTRTNRIGVGFTGIHEFAYKFFGYGFRDLIDEEKSKDFWETMARFGDAVRDEASRYSKEMGLNEPHTTTTAKPAGSTSKLFSLSEGCHLPSMKFYLRWVQFRDDDPLVTKYKLAGYPVKKLTTYEGTTIVGFPTTIELSRIMPEEQIVTAAEASPEEQYQWLMLLEKYYIRGTGDVDTGNQLSYTLKYNPTVTSYDAFREMMLKYQPLIKCCSVMPQTETVSFEYQPEEAILREQYEEIVRAIQQDLDESVSREHLNCANGACPIDFKEAVATT